METVVGPRSTIVSLYFPKEKVQKADIILKCSQIQPILQRAPAKTDQISLCLALHEKGKGKNISLFSTTITNQNDEQWIDNFEMLIQI